MDEPRIGSGKLRQARPATFGDRADFVPTWSEAALSRLQQLRVEHRSSLTGQIVSIELDAALAGAKVARWDSPRPRLSTARSAMDKPLWYGQIRVNWTGPGQRELRIFENRIKAAGLGFGILYGNVTRYPFQSAVSICFASIFA